MKNYSFPQVKKYIAGFVYDGMGCPEWDETGKSSWSHVQGFNSLTEKDMAKLIDAGLLSYSPYDDRFVPASVYDEKAGQWLI